MKSKIPKDLILVTRAEQQIAETLGYTVRQLHAIWKKGKAGDLEADKTIRGILNDYPRARILMNAFIRDAKGVSRKNTNKPNPNARSGKKRSKLNKPESIWTSAKPNWISVSSGGLPSLGRRR